MDNNRRFPIDVDALKKGDVIPREKVEECVKAVYGTEDFRFKLLSFCGWLDTQLLHRQMDVSIRTRRGAVEILRDVDATEYDHQKQMMFFKRSKRAFDKLCAVDIGELPKATRDIHEKRLLLGGLLIRGAELGMKGQLQITPYKRDIPLIT